MTPAIAPLPTSADGAAGPALGKRKRLRMPERALVAKVILGPRLRNDLGRLLEAGAALLAVHAVHLKVDPRIPEPDAKLQPAA